MIQLINLLIQQTGTFPVHQQSVYLVECVDDVWVQCWLPQYFVQCFDGVVDSKAIAFALQFQSPGSCVDAFKQQMPTVLWLPADAVGICSHMSLGEINAEFAVIRDELGVVEAQR